MRPSLYQQICVLWHHLQLNQTVQPSDCIVLFCDSDIRVIEHAAALYNKHVASRILIVQNAQNLSQTESEPFEIQEVLADLGVELSAISTLPREHFDHDTVARKLNHPQNLLIATAPYAQKSMSAQLTSAFSDMKLIFSSPALEPIDYASQELPFITLIYKILENAARCNWKNSAFNAADRHALQAFQHIKALLD
ncbi:MAG: hypothetical protein ACRC9T_03720 [Vibrionaceae bacterium]